MPAHSEYYYIMWKDVITMIADLIFLIINNWVSDWMSERAHLCKSPTSEVQEQEEEEDKMVAVETDGNI